MRSTSVGRFGVGMAGEENSTEQQVLQRWAAIRRTCVMGAWVSEDQETEGERFGVSVWVEDTRSVGAMLGRLPVRIVHSTS